MTCARVLLAVFLAAPAFAAAPSGCSPQKVAKKAKLTFASGAAIVADVVDTPDSREIGLMCVTKLKPNYGMLFVFPEEANFNFWMKNTLVSLDIVWIRSDKTVSVVHERMKKSRVDTPDRDVAVASGRGQYVLELPAGAAAKRGLKAGDRLEFSVETPKL
jgi:uncharacterized membrane protein (UPF0127 family)